MTDSPELADAPSRRGDALQRMDLRDYVDVARRDGTLAKVVFSGILGGMHQHNWTVARRSADFEVMCMRPPKADPWCAENGVPVQELPCARKQDCLGLTIPTEHGGKVMAHILMACYSPQEILEQMTTGERPRDASDALCVLCECSCVTAGDRQRYTNEVGEGDRLAYKADYLVMPSETNGLCGPVLQPAVSRMLWRANGTVDMSQVVQQVG